MSRPADLDQPKRANDLEVRPVPEKLDRVTTLIERIEVSVSRLSERLDPVMSPTGATEALRGENPQPSQSLISNKMDSFSEQLLSIEARICTIIDRLEI